MGAAHDCRTVSGHLTRAAGAVIDTLTAAGVRATGDPRNLTPPGILVTPQSSERVTRGAVAVVLQLMCIAPGPANADALGAVDGLADAATIALDATGIPWDTGTVATMGSGPAGESLLTYTLQVTFTTRI